jgi:heme A synthase
MKEKKSMSAAAMMKRFAETSPRFKARMAGVFFLLTMLTAAFTELFVRISGRLNFAADLTAGIVEVSGMFAVTLLFYDIFKPVNRASLCSRRPSTSWHSPLRLFSA